LNVNKHNSGASGEAEIRGWRVSKRTSKRRGELAELAFVLKAASLGFAVAKPYGDSDRYDFILDSGTRLFRVQVKSASRLWQGAYFMTTQRCCNGVAIPYTAAEIDFLAVYVFLEDAWFVVPVEELSTKTSIRVFPRERGEHGDVCRVPGSVVPDGVWTGGDLRSGSNGGAAAREPRPARHSSG
jgi:PD-(D/E)XK endonuclease